MDEQARGKRRAKEGEEDKRAALDKGEQVREGCEFEILKNLSMLRPEYTFIIIRLSSFF